MKPPVCTFCGGGHYVTFCFMSPKKAPKRLRRPKQLGRRGLEYIEWRDSVAIPYLDKTYGHVCANCGVGGKLDVQHKKKRGSHPHLIMELSNTEYLCRSCHIKAT